MITSLAITRSAGKQSPLHADWRKFAPAKACFQNLIRVSTLSNGTYVAIQASRTLCELIADSTIYIPPARMVSLERPYQMPL